MNLEFIYNNHLVHNVKTWDLRITLNKTNHDSKIAYKNKQRKPWTFEKLLLFVGLTYCMKRKHKSLNSSKYNNIDNRKIFVLPYVRLSLANHKMKGFHHYCTL